MASKGARLKRQIARQCQPISEKGMVELTAKRDQTKENLMAALQASPYDPKKTNHLRIRLAMLNAKIEEMNEVQHMNPPPSVDDRPPTGFTAMARQDEIRRLENELKDLADHRQDILTAIETEHATMLARVLTNVSDYEQQFWLHDRKTVQSMAILDALRAKNTPLRTQVWDLQAKIKALKEEPRPEVLAYHPGGAL